MSRGLPSLATLALFRGELWDSCCVQEVCEARTACSHLNYDGGFRFLKPEVKLQNLRIWGLVELIPVRMTDPLLAPLLSPLM